MKAASSLCYHFIKSLPLYYNVVVRPADITDPFMCIEAIFENSGILLSDLKYADVRLIHNLMYQSIKILTMFYNCGLLPFIINSDNIIYNRKEDLLKVIGLNNMIAVGENKAGQSVSVIKDWTLRFCSIILSEKKSGLEQKCGLNSEEEKEQLIADVKDKLNKIETNHFIEVTVKSFIKETLISACKDDSGVSVREIYDKIKASRETNKIRAKHTKRMLKHNKKLIDHLLFDNEQLANANKHKKVEAKCNAKMNCGGRVCLWTLDVQELLNKNNLQAADEKEEYKYRGNCVTCKTLKVLRSIRLDCGCKWTSIGKKIEVVDKGKTIDCGKCFNNHDLSATDSCLISDYQSMKLVFLMLSDYSKKNPIPDIFYRDFGKEEGRYIEWVLKHTEFLDKLELHTITRNEKEYKGISEGLKVNRTLKILAIPSYTTKDIKPISEALKFNKGIEKLEMARGFTDSRVKFISEVLKHL
eukprot:TRINITY_DN12438_c0_g1_i2.p1 TRINITY_DN12438_c0_g1~~TRINITY_DN12438_c0_g1_i2.p1  ORF type:complete len:471 (-),score=50.20 TRINITY_DN12438_c0_g1_i2:142-1554(-)